MAGRLATVRTPLVYGGEGDVVEFGGTMPVGTYTIPGFTIPDNCIIKSFNTKAYKTLASGGAATVSFGLKDLLTGTVVVNSLAVAQAFGAFNQPNPGAPFPWVAGVNFAANPLQVFHASSVVMVVAGATLTAGAICFYIDYEAFAPGNKLINN